MPRKSRFPLTLLTAALALLIGLFCWVWWGDWPGSLAGGEVKELGIIVVLGGGNDARVREAARLAGAFPDVPLLVTGDSGFILAGLLDCGIPESRIFIEPAATSTWENAVLSKPWLRYGR